jgi:hypothetical protein
MEKYILTKIIVEGKKLSRWNIYWNINNDKYIFDISYNVYYYNEGNQHLCYIFEIKICKIIKSRN